MRSQRHIPPVTEDNGVNVQFAFRGGPSPSPSPSHVTSSLRRTYDNNLSPRSENDNNILQEPQQQNKQQQKKKKKQKLKSQQYSVRLPHLKTTSPHTHIDSIMQNSERSKQSSKSVSVSDSTSHVASRVANTCSRSHKLRQQRLRTTLSEQGRSVILPYVETTQLMQQRHLERNMKPIVDNSRQYFKASNANHLTTKQANEMAAANAAALRGQPQRGGQVSKTATNHFTQKQPIRIVVANPKAQSLYTNLRALCMKSDKSMLRMLVEARVDINISDSSGHTVLMYVASQGKSGIEMLEFLLRECNADPNLGTTQGYTALHIASERRPLSTAAVRMLMRYGANPKIRDVFGRTAKTLYKQKQALMEGGILLRRAVQNGNVYEAEQLLRQCVSVDTTNSCGSTVLMMAVKSTHKGLVQLLLEHNASTNVQTPNTGNTALHEAMQHDQHTNRNVRPIIEMLLAYGASNIVHNNDGMTPLELGQRVLQTANGKLPAAFKRVCIEGDEPAVIQFLQDGFETALLNARDEMGRTPLIYSVMYKNEGVCRILLRAKARSNLKEISHTGNTALHYAYIQNDENFIELLTQFGADKSITNALGFNCIDARKSAIARLKRKQNERAHHSHNSSIPFEEELQEAICERYDKMAARLLLLNKFDEKYINGQDSHGNSYLMQLVLDGNENALRMATYCIDRLNANMDIKNHHQWTALHLAYENGNNRMIALLEDRGANVNIADAIGFTPKNLADRHAAVKNEAKLKMQRAAAKAAAEPKWVDSRLHASCRDSDYSEVRHLVNEGCDVNAQLRRGGDTMLMEAIRRGDFKLVKLLISLHADVNIMNQSGDTAIHIAAQLGRVDMYEYLIERADPPFEEELKNFFGFTAKALLNVHQHSEKSKTLAATSAMAPKVAYNLELEQCANLGDTAAAQEVLAQLRIQFLSALRNTQPKLWEKAQAAKLAEKAAFEAALLNQKLEITPTQLAESEDPDALCAQFLRNILNMRSQLGSTVTILAVENRQIDMVKLFLDYEADPNTQNARGMTALHAASVLIPPVEGLVSLLKDHGANESVTTKVGFTAAAMLANVQRVMRKARTETPSQRFQRRLEAANKVLTLVQDIAIAPTDEELEENGGGHDDCDDSVQPSQSKLIGQLHDFLRGILDDDSRFKSAENRELDVAAILDLPVRNGENIAFMAIRLDSYDALDVILQYGGNANAVSKHGQTLLHMAYEIGNPEIVEYLIELGADLTATDNMGYTPLEHGRFEAARRRRANRIKADKLMDTASNGLHELSTDLLDAVLSRKPDLVRVIVEDKKQHVDGQAVDFELKRFFALSRFSGNKLQFAMQKIKHKQASSPTSHKLKDDDAFAALVHKTASPLRTDSIGSASFGQRSEDEEEDGADNDESDINKTTKSVQPLSQTWSKLRDGVAGHQMVNALLSTADSSRMHEVKGNKDEKIIDNGDNENQDARAKRMAFINAKDVPGSTVLMAAAWQGNLSMVKLLIRSLRSNPNIHNTFGISALHCALANNHTSVVEYLLSNSKVQKLAEIQNILILADGREATNKTVQAPFKKLLRSRK